MMQVIVKAHQMVTFLGFQDLRFMLQYKKTRNL
jgi:hypothetical protein